jgi:acetyl esterase/lipase
MKRRPLLIAAAASPLLAACSPTGLLNRIAAGGAKERRLGLAYGDHPRQRLDVYVPGGPPPAAGWPGVLFFYGGSWNDGERGDYRFVGEALAERGMLAAVADYRLYPQVRYPDFLHDSAQALAWWFAQAPGLGADPARLHVMGHSAGAYNAAMLAIDGRWLRAAGSTPRRLAGWIGLAGPYDFLPIRNPEVQPVFMHPHYPPDSQVFAHIDSSSSRALLLAAADDDLVDPQRNTVGLAERLRANGVAVTSRLYPRVNHLTLVAALARPLRWLAPVLDDVSGFVAAD